MKYDTMTQTMRHRPSPRLAIVTLWALLAFVGGVAVDVHAAVIDTVRTGEVTFSGVTQNVTLSPALGDLTKSILFFNVRHNSNSPQQGLVRGSIIDASTLRFAKSSSGTSVTVRWYAVEFSAGVSVQRGTTAQTATVTNAAISPVTLSETFVLISRQQSSNNYSNDEFLRTQLTSATNLEMALNSGSGGNNDWQVVSMPGAVVQRGTLTLAAGSASTTQAISAVDTTRSFVLYSYNSPNGTQSNIGQKMVQAWLSSPTQVTFQRNNTGVALSIAWEVVQLPAGDHVQERLHSFANGIGQQDAAINTIDAARAVAFSGSQAISGLSWGRTPYAADDNPGIASFTFSFVDNSTLRLQRSGTAATADVTSFVVEFAAPNAAPILSAIGPQSVNEGATLNLPVSASDPEATIPILTAENLPSNASFTDNSDGTGALVFTPDFTQAGVYNVTFIASDGALADTEIVAITVNDVNQAPVLAAIGPRSVNESANLNFGVSATDADGTTPSLAAENLPLNATFTDNSNGTGSFVFNPDFTQAGVYNVRFIASDGALADTEIVAITVNNVNRAPVLAAIGPQAVNENAPLAFGTSATDPDAEPLTMTAVGLPTGAVYTDNGNGTASFSWTPDFTQAGVYNLTFITSDGGLADSEIVAITVNNVNLAPVLAAIGPQSVDEGQTLNLPVSATDPDATIPTLTAENLPLNATFTDNTNGTGAFVFNPDFSQAGVYNVRFIASDGALADTEIVAITVNQVNLAPVLAGIGPQSVNENANLNFGVSATDADGTIAALTAENLPLNAAFTDNANGTGAFVFNPDFTQAGTYNVRFIASDGSLADTEIVAITVSDVNRAPVLAAIGPQSVNENANLSFGVSAADADGTTPSLAAEILPLNASFTDNANGTGSFVFNPDYTQAGIYNVRFIASDGSLADTEIVAITVNDINQAPVLAAIGPQSVNEEQVLNLPVSAADPDATIPALTAENLPLNASFTDNANGTGSFVFNPDFTQAGLHNVMFIASDGALADTEIVAITVNDVNQVPVLAAIGPQSVNENANLSFGVSATDADGTTPLLGAENLPLNATFADNANGTGAFVFNPDFTQAGTYNVRFIASDGSLADTEIVAITVSDVNRAPVLSAIGPQNVNEGGTLNLPVAATDPDATTPILTAENLPLNASFTDNGNGTGALVFNPDYTQAGVYNVTFIASDGASADSEVVAITVNNVNQAPVLAAIGPQSVNEGQALNLPVSATDADATIPMLIAENLPLNASFTDNANGTGSFVFNPDFTHAGVYNVRFIASDGALADTELVAITVNHVNLAPVLAVIGPQSVNENALLTFGTSASDPDSDPLAMTAVGLPTGAVYIDNGNGTASFSWTPDFNQAGVYNVTFIASDGGLADSEIVAITVANVNRPPLLSAIGPQTGSENTLLAFNTSASDPDAEPLTLSAVNLPVGASFTDNGNGNGAAAFAWTPDYTQAGAYNVTFIASDGAAADSEIVAITINDVNQPPVLTAIGSQSVDEGQALNLPISATDPDASIPTLTAENLPLNATFTDNINGTGSFVFNPDFTQAGVYNVRFIATDGALADTEIVAITVNNVNRAPALAVIGPQSVNENALLTFGASASDPDSDPLAMTAVGLPTGAVYTDNGNGTATFNWTPDYTQAGVYNITFIASDGSLADSEAVAVTVNNVNLPPVLAAIGPQSVNEGQPLNLPISATEPDATIPTLVAENLPLNASFADNANGTGSFVFNPDYTQAGIYSVRFIASDGALADTEIVAITVNNVNQAPVLAAIGPQSVDEGQALNLPVSGTDPDATIPSLSAENLPPNASFTDNANGTGSFLFNPDLTQAGVYNVRFIASDGGLADTEIVAITVNNVNQAPVLAAIGPQSVNEGAAFNLPVSATDPDATIPTLTAENLPLNASFIDNANGTGAFVFNPDFTQAGVYNVRFIASDGVLADTEIVAITVNDVNQAPALAAIGPQSVDENTLLAFVASAVDPDGTTPAMSATGLPTGANYTDNGDGTGSFAWTPDFSQSGVYNVTFIASDGLLADSEVVAITVNNFNQLPTLAAIGPQSVNEGQTLNLAVSASDPDATVPALLAENIPVNATFTDNGNGTGAFVFSPDFTQAGVYNVTFIAADGALADTEIVAITVDNVNLPPVLAAIGPQSVDEGQTLNLPVSATDPDASIPTLIAENLPLNASFTDNGNGAGSFVFNPDFTQAGVYNVRFIVSDGALADTEIVAITVNNVNQAPVLAAIGPQSVNEGQSLNVAVSATDADGTTPSLTAENLPLNATLTDNGNGTGAFVFNPTFTQAGVYNIRFIANDGALADTELVAVTVNNVNLAPVLSAIGAKSVDEGMLLSFGASAADPDGTTPVLTVENAPVGAVYTDNGNGTATFTFTPDYTQAGVYNARFIASDGALADTEIVAITVTNVNLRPVLNAIGPQSVNEGQTLNLPVSATDPDATTPTLVAENVPLNAAFTDNGNGTGAFVFTPDFTQSGVYNIRFIATDGALADTEIVAITVNNVNRAPALVAIGPRSVTEGQVLNFAVSATDPDAQIPTLTAENVPANASFVDNGNGTGAFSFSPNFIQASVYNVTFIASDGALADTEIVAITVNEAGNQPPVLAPIGTRSVTEGNTLAFRVSATDPEFATLTLFTSILPTGAVFVDSGNGAGSFTWTPTFTQAGTYFVTFAAQDPPGAIDNELVRIDVLEAGNQRPALAAIGPKSVAEGGNLSFATSATDVDGTTPVMSAVGVPANATYTDNGNGTGSFVFNPAFGQAGVYNVTFIASDGALADSEVVAITVGNVNEAPILAAIGPKSVDENALLNFATTATDPDGTTPALTAENLPIGATYTDNGNGTAAFAWTPDYTQAGVYNVRFIASDGALADTEVVAITVNNVNRAPALAAIGPQTVNEGALLSFATSAADPDGTIPALTAENLPTGATYTDNGNGTASFNFAPDFTQAGVYNVRFLASDGALADTEIVAITVNDVNQAPVMATIGPRSVAEGALLSFTATASDPDGGFPVMTAENLPLGATYTDNGDGTAAFNFTPDFTQAGVYNVRFIASDGLLADSELVTITVTEFNRPPALAAIGPQSVNEGQSLNVPVSATDPDGSIPSLTAENLPLNAVFSDNGNGTGALVFNPDLTQSGVYNVRFIASDGSLADTELVAITVNQVNLAPTLAAIGAQSVDEGQTLNLPISATDPDATTPTLTAENLPLNAVFTDNGNGSGSFVFTPDFTQAGVYNVRFIASDGVLADTELVAITVNNVNRAPVLAAIGPQTVAEGGNLNFAASATDPDGTVPALTAVNVPTNASFIDNGNGTGTFNFSPDFSQAGVFNVTFIASDGVLADSEVVAITVTGTNLAPVLDPIGARAVDEGQNLNFSVSAADPDGVAPSLLAENAPANAAFIDNGNGTGTFDFSPDFTQAGVYNVRFIATDGLLSDTELVAITVNQVNLPPVLATIGPRSVAEGATLNVNVAATDPDATTPILTAENLPLNTSFVDNLNGTGAFDFSPDFTQAGVYNVTFIASDGALADTEIVAITVNETNLPPVLAAIGPQSVNEGATLNIGVSATDPDATTPVLTAENLPPNASFVDNLNGTGAFSFTPDFTQAGVHNVTFIAADGVLADTEIVAITVNNVNLPPVLAAIGAQSVNEDANLNFSASASDPDLTTPSLSAENLPLNASFVDNLNGTGTFNFDPDFTQAGFYNVTFIASDGVLADTEIVAITVNNTNRAPVLAAIGAQTVAEGANLNFAVSATDPDLTTPTLTAISLPLNATFVDNFDGTGTFNFDPDFTQAGVYDVTFIASDGALADSEVVAITVTGTNLPPTLAAIGPRSVIEGQNLNFAISASDPDGFTPILAAVNVPVNATFVDNGNGTGTFDFNPNFVQAGIYNVTFIASDGLMADSEIVAITVNEAGNQAPTLASIGPRSVTEGLNLNFSISASDPDQTIPTLAAESLPLNATFTDLGNGTGTFDFNPDFTQAGVYNVRFIAADGARADTEVVAITVNDAGNQRPVLATIGAQSVTEGQNLTFGVSATDPDASIPALLAENVPANATFTDNGDGSGSFVFNPDFTQAGVFNVRFIATDGALADTEVVAVTVTSAGNQRPVLAAIGPRTVDENQNLSFNISASDPDATTPVLFAPNLPPGATFDDNGNGTGSFDWTPTFTQAGVYNVRFVATDGALADTEIVAITVNNVNRAPVLAAIGPRSVNEGATLNVGVSATDPDAQIPALIAENLPLHATFTDNGSGTGAFVFNPDSTQAGVYNVRFIASDGLLADTEIVAITVNQVNLAPVLAAIGPQMVNEGATLNIGVSATDFDGTIPTLAAENVPANGGFADNGNGTGAFVFNPNFSQAGVYNVRFIASDGVLADTEIVAITVNNVNLAPVLNAIGPQSVNENAGLNVPVSATDPDGTVPSLSAENLPANATFADNGNGSGSLTFNPDFTQAGVYNVRFIASDGALADTEVVAITVNDVNAPPVLAAIGPKAVAEAANLNFVVTASDIDATIPSLSAVGVPANATFVDNGNGSGTFDFTPDFTQSGVYNVTFIASDGLLADSEVVQITVTENNRQPLADAGPDQGPVAIGFAVTLNGSASSDPDGDSLGYHWRQIAGPAVTVADSTSALASFTPAIGGAYAFRLIVDDAQLASAPDTTLVTVVSQPARITDLMATVSGNAIQLSWSPVTADTSGSSTTLTRYVVYRGTRAYFAPTPAESIGVAAPAAVSFTDNNIGGADVVGDTGTNYFYCLQAVDASGGRSAYSNRVGEYDYQIYTTSTTDFSFVMMPFANTGINTASDLIQSIGVANVNTVNRFIAASQSYEARFAAGFGTNFPVVPGGIYQVNAKAPTVWSIAGRVPDSGTISYSIVTTSTTDFEFIGIPFERELDYSVAQDIIDAIPGVLNTLNRFIPTSQSYESRFYLGFGPNFPVRAGRVYQANARANGVFPAP